MASWAPITSKVDDRGFGESRYGNTINGIVPHIGAGLSVLNYVSGWNSRENHPTYHIDRYGVVTGLVHPNKRPTTTAHSIDQEAVTVEMDNTSTGGDWPISDATMASLIQLIIHHGGESNRKGFALNVPGKNQSQFFIAWHAQYHQVTCPGAYVLRNLQHILAAARGNVTTGPSKAPVEITPKPSTPSKPKPSWAFNKPSKAVQRRIQQALRNRGRYSGPVDGVWGPNSIKGIQYTIKQAGHYNGPVDGVPGTNTCAGVQAYAKRFGSYTGPQDRVLGPYGWAGFALGLERP